MSLEAYDPTITTVHGMVLFREEHVNVCACVCVLDIQRNSMIVRRTSVQRGRCSSHRRRYSHSKYRIKRYDV